MLALVDGDVFIHQAAWGKTSQKAAEGHLRALIQQTLEATFATECLIGAGTDYNFRKDFFEFYKRSNSREASRDQKQDWFSDFKGYIHTLPDVVPAIGYETDDLIRIWARQATESGDPFVICSIDKDLDCIEGLHFNNKHNTFYTIGANYANSFYWQQILSGDSVDNIPGLPRIGPVKAEKMLEGLSTNEERKQRVIQAYKDVYQDSWKEYLLANGRLIHIWRYMNDHFTLD